MKKLLTSTLKGEASKTESSTFYKHSSMETLWNSLTIATEDEVREGAQGISGLLGMLVCVASGIQSHYMFCR